MASPGIVKRGNLLGGAHYRDRTACSNGHEYVEGSFYMSKPDINGYSSRRCRACNRAKKRKSSTPEYREKKRQQDRLRHARARLSPEEFAVWEAEELAKKKNPLEYLKLNPDQSAASDELNYAFDRLKSKTACQKPVMKMHPTRGVEVETFPFIDIDEREPYTAAQAEEMCADCPVLKQCRPYAEVLKPPVGVLGGLSWVDGKPQK